MAMTLDRLPQQSLADRVAEQIREAIYDGRYAGSRLVERTLADELGVSHIPVREALARLADAGLVERLPRRGARVATLTEKELTELSTLRALLEQFVVARVQERLTPALVAELRAQVAAMRAAAAAGDVQRLLDLDQQFHELLWRHADHDLLSEFAAQLRRRITAFLRAATAALGAGELERHAAAHEQLIEAIAGGDAAVARAAMTRHIEAAAARLRRGAGAEPAPAATRGGAR